MLNKPKTHRTPPHFVIDEAAFASMPSPVVEIEAEVIRRRAEQYAAMPISRGLRDFTEEYRQADLRRLRGLTL